MAKINSLEELLELNKKYKPILKLRNLKQDEIPADEKNIEKRDILICGGTGCKASKSEQILRNFNRYIDLAGLSDKVHVSITGCFGFCEKGPIVKVLPDNVFYTHVTPEDVEDIVRDHLVKGNVVERLLYEEPTLKEKVKRQDQMSFYGKQHRIALRNCGLINPEDITEYIAEDGYLALGKVLTSMTPDEVIQTMIDSGLRGRGGGGFPTGQKWLFAKKSKSKEKYIICNADEGDPGAFMDRSILEGDPNSVIEAMAIAG